jgi:hypothetical protein
LASGGVDPMRGQRLMAFYASMYYAALRPAEVVGLRRQDCHLPETGWGRLTLEKHRAHQRDPGRVPISPPGSGIVCIVTALLSESCRLF